MIHFAVVGHHTRRAQAEALAERLSATLFVDELTLGANFNHLRALNWGATLTGHLIVVEDDALPVEGFEAAAEAWIADHPDDLTSFYLGTGIPLHYQPRIAAQLAEVDAGTRECVSFGTLLSAVAYAIPCSAVATLKHNPRGVPDITFGTTWFKTHHRPILYTVPSLVDHTDGESIAQPNNRHPERKAWRLP